MPDRGCQTSRRKKLRRKKIKLSIEQKSTPKIFAIG